MSNDTWIAIRQIYCFIRYSACPSWLLFIRNFKCDNYFWFPYSYFIDEREAEIFPSNASATLQSKTSEIRRNKIYLPNIWQISNITNQEYNIKWFCAQDDLINFVPPETNVLSSLVNLGFISSSGYYKNSKVMRLSLCQFNPIAQKTRIHLDPDLHHWNNRY